MIFSENYLLVIYDFSYQEKVDNFKVLKIWFFKSA